MPTAKGRDKGLLKTNNITKQKLFNRAKLSGANFFYPLILALKSTSVILYGGPSRKNL